MTTESQAASPVVAERTGWLDTQLFRLGLVVLLVGIAFRLTRYLLNLPLWCDEVFVAFSLLKRDYSGLMSQLEYEQITPLLFLWMQKAVFDLLGSSPLALRLLPLLAGIASMILFAHLAWTLLRPLPASLAIAFLAFSRFPIQMSATLKPYSFDLFFALVLLVAAVHWLRNPDRWGWLALLVSVIPVAVFTSYPIVFVGGAVSLALLPQAWNGDWRTRLLYAAYNGMMLGGFALAVLVIGAGQLGNPGESGAHEFYMDFWKSGFPPESLAAVPNWLFKMHAGPVFAYPAGGNGGGSIGTLLLCLAGLWALMRERRISLILLLVPFGLALTAAFLRRYPYGGCTRLHQELAPAICIMAGCGVAAVIELFRSNERRTAAAAWVATALLAVVGVAVVAQDQFTPGEWERVRNFTVQVLDEVKEQLGPDDQVVVVRPMKRLDSVVRWQLETGPVAVCEMGDVDLARLERGGRLICLNVHRGSTPAEIDPALLRRANRGKPLPDGRFSWPRSARREVETCLANVATGMVAGNPSIHLLDSGNIRWAPHRIVVFVCEQPTSKTARASSSQAISTTVERGVSK